MTATSSLKGPSLPPISGTPARELIVLLHGLGADGQDLISLAPMMAEFFPDAYFVAPNAPEPCDMAPFGYQWFSLQNRVPHVMYQGAQASAPLLGAFLDAHLDALSLAEDNMALVGFSQGTMMALHTALRRSKPCAAITGFSGALLMPESLPAEITSRPPVCLIHGDADSVVAYTAMAMAETALKQTGVPVETHTRPGLGHGIDPEGIEIAIHFLQRHLSAAV